MTNDNTENKSDPLSVEYNKYKQDAESKNLKTIMTFDQWKEQKQAIENKKEEVPTNNAVDTTGENKEAPKEPPAPVIQTTITLQQFAEVLNKIVNNAVSNHFAQHTANLHLAQLEEQNAKNANIRAQTAVLNAQAVELELKNKAMQMDINSAIAEAEAKIGETNE